jgi:hypothetical protein
MPRLITATYIVSLVVVLMHLNSCYASAQQLRTTPLSRREAVLDAYQFKCRCVAGLPEPALHLLLVDRHYFSRLHKLTCLWPMPHHVKKRDEAGPPSLIPYLHGAGKNDKDMLSDLGSIQGVNMPG